MPRHAGRHQRGAPHDCGRVGVHDPPGHDSWSISMSDELHWDGRAIRDVQGVVIAARRAVWTACQSGVFAEFEPAGGWASEGLATCGVPGCADCPVLPEPMGWLSGPDGESLVWAA